MHWAQRHLNPLSPGPLCAPRLGAAPARNQQLADALEENARLRAMRDFPQPLLSDVGDSTPNSLGPSRRNSMSLGTPPPVSAGAAAAAADSALGARGGSSEGL
jgi:hypothetical protein